MPNINIFYSRIKFAALILTVLLSIDLNAQDDLPKVTLETPRNAVNVHLSYLQKESYDPEKSSQALDVENPGSQRAKELATKLKEIMDARGLWVTVANVPDDPDYTDSVSGDNKYVLFQREPDIYLSKTAGKWQYSKETVRKIPAMYKETFPFDKEGLMKSLPEFAYGEFLGIQVWQYLGLLLYLLLSFVFYKVFSWIMVFFVKKIFSRFRMKDIFDSYILPISHPLSILIVVILWSVSISFLNLPVQLSFLLSKGFQAAIPLVLIVIGYRLSNLVCDVLAKLSEKTATKVDDNLIPLLRKALKVGVVIFGVIYFISTLGWNITPLLAGASIGGLAFALAAQDTLKNFFGSVTIYSDQPFENGDWIIFDGGEGMVEDVGIRSTRIRTFYNSLVSVPNGKLADAVIDNMGRRKYRRYFTKISVTYDTPPDLLDAYVEGLKDITNAHPHTWKDFYQIHLNELDAASINILFYIFFDVPDWSAELKARHEIISNIIRLADDLGVRFAFPTQTIHIEEIPGQDSLTPVYKENRNDFMKKVKDFKVNKLKSGDGR